MNAKPHTIVYGVEGSNIDEVGALVAQHTNQAVTSSIQWLKDNGYGDDGVLMIEKGEQAVRDAQRHAFDALINTEGVIVLHGSILEDDDARQRVRDAQRQGTRVIKCIADISDITSRLGMNRPRAVAFGPVRMQLQTFIRQRDEVWSDIVPDLICDTSVTDWKKQLLA